MKVMTRDELQTKILNNYMDITEIQGKMFEDIVNTIEVDLFHQPNMMLFDLVDSNSVNHERTKKYVYDTYNEIIDRYLYACYNKADYTDFLEELTDYLI